jgi:hypothetical protein
VSHAVKRGGWGGKDAQKSGLTALFFCPINRDGTAKKSVYVLEMAFVGLPAWQFRHPLLTATSAMTTAYAPATIPAVVIPIETSQESWAGQRCRFLEQTAARLLRATLESI